MKRNKMEEKLREASCLGDLDAVQILLSKDVDVNSRHQLNGWTALHWACKRNHESIARLLIAHGADASIENSDGKKPSEYCTKSSIAHLFGSDAADKIPSVPTGSSGDDHATSSNKFTPNYIRNAPLNGQVDICPRFRPSTISSLPTTSLPASDDLIVKVRTHGSNDPDFIEVEIPRWKLTYNTLVRICCEEMEIAETQVERIRKLPDTRLRKDSDVKRLTDYCNLEIVLKAPGIDHKQNAYQSISTCKNQTILY